MSAISQVDFKSMLKNHIANVDRFRSWRPGRIRRWHVRATLHAALPRSKSSSNRLHSGSYRSSGIEWESSKDIMSFRTQWQRSLSKAISKSYCTLLSAPDPSESTSPQNKRWMTQVAPSTMRIYVLTGPLKEKSFDFQIAVILVTVSGGVIRTHQAIRLPSSTPKSIGPGGTGKANPQRKEGCLVGSSLRTLRMTSERSLLRVRERVSAARRIIKRRVLRSKDKIHPRSKSRPSGTTSIGRSWWGASNDHFNTQSGLGARGRMDQGGPCGTLVGMAAVGITLPTGGRWIMVTGAALLMVVSGPGNLRRKPRGFQVMPKFSRSRSITNPDMVLI